MVHPRQKLMVFTRYPEPGKTKTRLIPGLGAEGAAALQRQMTEHMLAIAQVWLDRVNSQLLRTESETGSPRSVQVRAQTPTQVLVMTSGGTEARFQDWLGDRWRFRPQAEGDLGDRMGQAFLAGFEAGCDRIVIIGIDCPDITADLLAEAFVQLDYHDLVLGPATDGGYYLIGLRAIAKSQAIPALFEAMDWGRETVRSVTLDRANFQDLSVALLEELTDVDHPEDLWVWEKHRR